LSESPPQRRETSRKVSEPCTIVSGDKNAGTANCESETRERPAAENAPVQRYEPPSELLRRTTSWSPTFTNLRYRGSSHPSPLQGSSVRSRADTRSAPRYRPSTKVPIL